MARWRCGLQGCAEYKDRESTGSYIKWAKLEGIFGAEYKVVQSTRIEKAPLRY